MSTRRIPIHSGTGRNRASDGALGRTHQGVNAAFGEQVFPEDLDKYTDYHGAVLPDDLDTSGTIALLGKFRQKGVGTGVVTLDAGMGVKETADDRDVRPASLLSGGVVTVLPGVQGKEFVVQWTFSSDLLAAGKELLFWIGRLGLSSASDSFGDEISLVGVELDYPIVEPEDDPTLLVMAERRVVVLEQIFDNLKWIRTILEYYK